MISSINKFLRTRESILFLFLGVMIYFLPTYTTLIFLPIGISLYCLTEYSAHVAMHSNKRNPFYMTHMLHHKDHSPESGVPEWWLFAVYGLVTLSTILISRPLIYGIWLGILSMLTIYEWIHFLYHCDYYPKTSLGRRMRENHLKHHDNPRTHFDVIIPRKDRI